MAQVKQKRKENIDGSFFVDDTCIDCDTCRWMAPEIFHRDGEQSAVFSQPETEEETMQALQALIACPTASIGCLDKEAPMQEAVQSFPLLIEDNVYHCGYHSEKSFGGASYIIKRPEGNVMIDSPRFNNGLAKKIEEMGGLEYIFLTHKDDVADHQKFHEYFGAKRVIHKEELCASVPEAEILLEDHFPIKLNPDTEADSLVMIPTPGHTKGHTVLLYNKKFLFTGDHLAYSKPLNRLVAFPKYCQYSWDKHIESMEKLIDYDYEWILPGHGRRIKSNAFALKNHVDACVGWMAENRPSGK